MFLLGFTLHRLLYYTHVWFLTNSRNLFLACAKDILAVRLIWSTYKKHYCKDNHEIDKQKKYMAKYFVFLAAFTLEDFGQVYLQYVYYEQFSTKISKTPIIKGAVMTLIAAQTVIDLAKLNVFTKSGKYWSVRY